MQSATRIPSSRSKTTNSSFRRSGSFLVCVCLFVNKSLNPTSDVGMRPVGLQKHLQTLHYLESFQANTELLETIWLNNPKAS